MNCFAACNSRLVERRWRMKAMHPANVLFFLAVPGMPVTAMPPSSGKRSMTADEDAGPRVRCS